MAGDDKNDRYRAGRVDQELENINGTLKRLEGKLDDNLDWQTGVDVRLAGGVEKFRTQDTKIKAAADKAEINRKNIIRVGSVNLTLTGIAAYIAARLGMNGG